MRRKLILGVVLPAVMALAAGSSFAQSASDSISVTARNNGIFRFNIVGTTFDFGDVDSDGTLSTTGVTGARNGANNGAVYSANGVTTWTASSAPSRTVRLYNASTTSVINWGTADRLSVRVPAAGLPVGSTSCGFVAFSTAGDGGAGSCSAGALAHSMATGNGGNSAGGSLDLQLDVLDTDTTGVNTWTVVITATGV